MNHFQRQTNRNLNQQVKNQVDPATNEMDYNRIIKCQFQNYPACIKA